jgi:hypothetical protein
MRAKAERDLDSFIQSFYNQRQLEQKPGRPRWGVARPAVVNLSDLYFAENEYHVVTSLWVKNNYYSANARRG